MTEQEYITANLLKARTYHKQVLAGEVVCSKWIKLQAARFAEDLKNPDLYFNEDAVRRVFQFFSMLRIADKGEIRQFDLTPSQSWIIYFCFGLYKVSSDTRKIRRVYLFTAKKTGKTTFTAALQLYLMCYDREAYSDSILVAGSRDQANIAYNYALEMVKASPQLKSRFNHNETRAITWEGGRYGKCRLFTRPSKDLSFDGVNVHGGIVDEAHVHKDWKLVNNMTSATVARRQPMVFITSTAGFDMTYPFYDKVKIGEKVLTGDLDDDISAYFFYTLDDGDNPENPDVWEKSNPNIGHTVTMETMLGEYATAKLANDTWINFLVKNLNIWVNEAAQWLDEGDMQAANVGGQAMETFNDNDFFLGMDLSDTTDFNVLVYLTEHEGLFYAWSRYYCTKKTIKKRVGGIDVGPWIADGHAYLFDRKNMDLEKIGDDILETIREKEIYIRSVQFDPYNAKDLIFKLKNSGLFCEPHPQTTGTYNEPTKALERLVGEGRLILDGNPFNVFHLRNVVLGKDQNNNYKPNKKISLDAIDFAMALAMALNGYLKMHNNEFYRAMQMWAK